MHLILIFDIFQHVGFSKLVNLNRINFQMLEYTWIYSVLLARTLQYHPKAYGSKGLPSFLFL